MLHIFVNLDSQLIGEIKEQCDQMARLFVQYLGILSN